MRTRTAAITATALLATLAACSSSSHDTKPTPTPTKPTVRPTTNPPSTPPTTAPATTPPPTTDTPPITPQATSASTTALTNAVWAYSDAYFKPDPSTGYAMLSARCQASITKAEYAKELDRAVAMYGHQKIKTLSVDKANASIGIVTYTYANPLLDQTGQPWTPVNGHWRYDDC